MPDYLARAQRAYEQAQHFTALAQQAENPDVRSQLLGVADSYDRMSKQFLQLFASEKPGQPSQN